METISSITDKMCRVYSQNIGNPDDILREYIFGIIDHIVENKDVLFSSVDYIDPLEDAINRLKEELEEVKPIL